MREGREGKSSAEHMCSEPCSEPADHIVLNRVPNREAWFVRIADRIDPFTALVNALHCCCKFKLGRIYDIILMMSLMMYDIMFDIISDFL